MFHVHAIRGASQPPSALLTEKPYKAGGSAWRRASGALRALVGIALVAASVACTPSPQATDSRPDVPVQSGEQTTLFDAAGFTSMAVDDQNVLYLGGSFGLASLAPGESTPMPLETGSYPVSSLAVAADGTAYFVNIDNEVEALAPGAAAAQQLPFGKLEQRSQLAVGHDGSVYLADNDTGSLLKLAPGADRPVALPIKDLGSVGHMVMDAEDNLYAAVDGQIAKISNGADTAEPVPGATQDVGGLAVDTAGNLYATDVRQGTVSRMPAGGGDWIKLPFRDLQSPTRITVDSEGNVFVMAAQKNLGIHVIRLAVG